MEIADIIGKGMCCEPPLNVAFTNAGTVFIENACGKVLCRIAQNGYVYPQEKTLTNCLCELLNREHNGND